MIYIKPSYEKNIKFMHKTIFLNFQIFESLKCNSVIIHFEKKIQPVCCKIDFLGMISEKHEAGMSL